MEPDDLIAALRPMIDGALIATDFDGTLAPLRPDPEDSRPVAGTVEALRTLRERGAHVAVITGRDARTVLRLGGLDAVPALTVAGIYGVETWTNGELTTPDTPDAVHRLRDRLPAALDGADPGVWIEDKRLSLVVHARQAADPEAALSRIAASVAAVADELGFEVHPGSDVLEVRLPGHDKATALARLAHDLHPAAVLYLGDDLGDLSAFAQTARLREAGTPSWSVAVLSSGVEGIGEAADVRLPDPASAVALLSALAVR